MLLLYFVLSQASLAENWSNTFDWSAVQPSTSLIYHDCYSEFQCARLSVPLDWQNQSSQHSVAIAIIKLPASVPETDETFGGTVITNPGGPGGSGVSDLLVHGHYLQGIIDGQMHYEILSFDPRGVFHSTPRADCFEDEISRHIFDMQVRENGHLDAGNDTLKRRFSRAQAFGKLCADGESSRAQGGVNIQQYTSTASVSRDMLEIVDRVDELRRRELGINNGHGNEDPREDTHGIKREANLQYIGFSYGTQLGNTFASMFPDRVSRMVLDGVVHADDYTHGMWSSNLRDTEAAVMDFYDSCYTATDCPLRSESDSTGLDIKYRVDEFLDEIEKSPLTLVRGSSTELITARDIQAIFQIPIYMPVPYYDVLAHVLADLLAGNYTLLLQQMDGPLASDVCPLSDSKISNSLPLEISERSVQYTWGLDAALSYICGDGNDFSNVTILDLSDYIQRLQKDSPTLGATWAEFGFQCSGWKLRPLRFTGPFGRSTLASSVSDSQPTSVHDSNPRQQLPILRASSQRPRTAPVLFLSSKTDPVTPLFNAIAMSALHPGSAVVIQNSVGHCATYSSPSSCTKRLVEEYFDKGDIPENGTMCEPDCTAWNRTDKCNKFEPLGVNNIGPMRWLNSRLPLIIGSGEMKGAV